MLVGSIEYRQITADARFNFFYTPLQFGVMKLRSRFVDYFEFATVDGNQVLSEQSQC